MCIFCTKIFRWKNLVSRKINAYIVILERIHQFLGNLVRTYNMNKTYVDKDAR